MQYVIKNIAAASGSYSDTGIRLQKTRFSHLLIFGANAASLAADLAKIILDITLVGYGSAKRSLMTKVRLASLVAYSDILQGVGISGTEYFALIPLGDIDLKDQDLILDISCTSALTTATSINLYAMRLSDGDPVIEYEERLIDGAAPTKPNVLLMYDVNTSSASTKKTKLTFGNGTQQDIEHKVGFAMCQAVSKLETADTFGLIYSDKDCENGRTIKIDPGSDTFTAFIVMYGLFNY